MLIYTVDNVVQHSILNTNLARHIAAVRTSAENVKNTMEPTYNPKLRPVQRINPKLTVKDILAFSGNREELIKAWAKSHVKAALRAAVKEHKLKYKFKDPQSGDAKILDEESILLAYPLTNIQ